MIGLNRHKRFRARIATAIRIKVGTSVATASRFPTSRPQSWRRFEARARAYRGGSRGRCPLDGLAWAEPLGLA
ncbi:hypothetical protein HVIM_04279 [Roseomonas mucosa]|nr:hypothetical protein HVIM_04279 [Roseomonas mucosa]QDE00620.1 hypothetical protein ADP8_04279 [Roseomonas mucosa]